MDMFKTWREQDQANIVDPKWQKDNMEYDLRSTQWIIDKVKMMKYMHNTCMPQCVTMILLKMMCGLY
jgi:hypothetical protein